MPTKDIIGGAIMLGLLATTAYSATLYIELYKAKTSAEVLDPKEVITFHPGDGYSYKFICDKGIVNAVQPLGKGMYNIVKEKEK